MRTVAIIQARMGSQRLPGKVLADIAGKPMLEHIVSRTRSANAVDEVIVATSTDPGDDPIASLCKEIDVNCFRGNEHDVLDRFYEAAKSTNAELVVRITGDCPLTDGEVIDEVLRLFENDDKLDYATNTLPYTYPDGLDVEAFTFSALEKASQNATEPAEREHVTVHLRNSGNFTLANHASDIEAPAGNWRLTVDNADDLEFIRTLYARFDETPGFGYPEIAKLLMSEPDILEAQGQSSSNEGYYKSLFEGSDSGAAPSRSITRSEEWLNRATDVIPGCAQTFSKDPTQHVRGVSPIFLQRGEGARVWDVDGNEYIDFVQGLLPNILGYAHPEVNAAVAEQLGEGHCFSLPHPIEVELAEKLVALIPCADQVRFGKNGSDATAGAVRGARALTGRERIACSGYHGWQDWFIGTTSRDRGVPECVKELTHPFPYNDLPALEKLLQSHPNEFAAIIMEPVNFFEPDDGYLQSVKDLAHSHGALLIFDEVCSGFHFGLGGAQKKYGVTPDLACFGKALGNGFPISCIVGSKECMKIYKDVFFSFTFGGDVASITACLKTLEILERDNAIASIEANGKILQDGINTLAGLAGLGDRIQCGGAPSWHLMHFRDENGAADPILKALFQQECAKRGILFLTTHNLTLAHDHGIIEEALRIHASVIKTLGQWCATGDLEPFLEGTAPQAVFKVR